jgi:hypothetical protein
MPAANSRHSDSQQSRIKADIKCAEQVVRGKHLIYKQYMKIDIEIQRTAEALD